MLLFSALSWRLFTTLYSSVFELLSFHSSLLVWASVGLCNTARRSDGGMYYKIIATQWDQTGTTHRSMGVLPWWACLWTMFRSIKVRWDYPRHQKIHMRVDSLLNKEHNFSDDVDRSVWGRHERNFVDGGYMLSLLGCKKRLADRIWSSASM